MAFLQGSFIISSRGQRELREVVRYRRSLIQERARVVSRLKKVLEGANIKLSSVATDITSVSAQMIAALIKAATMSNTWPSSQKDQCAIKLRTWKRPRGKNRAAVAVGHSILIIAYHMLRNNQTHMELGAGYFEQK